MAKILMTYGIPRVKCIFSTVQERIETIFMITIERQIETTVRQVWKLQEEEQFSFKERRFYFHGVKLTSNRTKLFNTVSR